MKEFFDGYYYKHHKGKNTIAFIHGTASDGEFIQIITDTNSYHVPYIGNNVFNIHGIKIAINEKDFSISGEIKYDKITPIKYDIMGIFKYLPMECTHGIISMHHTLRGSLVLNGEVLDFTDGVGYIEKDSGTSFPKSYLWVQCNDFTQKSSIMASIADIPLYGLNFKGCICVVYYLGKEYRLATYLGVRIKRYNKNNIVLRQGKYRLEITINQSLGHKLYAPNCGKMSRTIHETPSCTGNFKFYINNKLLFNLSSDSVSFEFVE